MAMLNIKWNEVVPVTKKRSVAATQVRVCAYEWKGKKEGEEGIITQITIPAAIASKAGLSKGDAVKVFNATMKGRAYIRVQKDEAGLLKVGGAPRGEALAVRVQGLLEDRAEATDCELVDYNEGELVVGL